MNYVELNSILYYADYLSLRDISLPVTDNCKYFFVHTHPINSAFIAGCSPEYDVDNKYFIQAQNDYNKIKNMFEEDGVLSFVDDICFLRSCGMVDAYRMLLHIHLFSSKQERKQAFSIYNQWKSSKIYTHEILDEYGNPQQEQCTLFFKHAETARTRRNIQELATQDVDCAV